MEQADHLGRHARHRRGQGHHRRRARPARHRGADCSAPLADESVNVDMIVQNSSTTGTTDISFTVPQADLAGEPNG